MSWGVVAVAGASLVGGVMSSQAAQSAANTQANAANNASQVQQNQYNLSRQDQQPWLDSGRNALGQLNQQLPNLTRSFSLADFQQDPSYKFNLQQGQQAIERSAAARGGGVGGGATEKALMDYSQGVAGNQYQNAFNNFNTNQSNTFNRLAQVAGVGQQAATTTGQMGASAATNIGNNMTDAASAQSAGIMSQANSITNALNTGANAYNNNNWMQQQMLNRNPGSFSMGNNYGNTGANNYSNALGTYNY